MSEAEDRIRINRAPVLTLWAAAVAERLGFDRATALTLGQAMAGVSAYAKGVSLGLVELEPERVRERGERLAEGETMRVELLGRAVPVTRTSEGLRALDKGKAGDPARVERYLAAKFQDRLEDAQAAMAKLAAAFEPAELNRRGLPALRGVPARRARGRARLGYRWRPRPRRRAGAQAACLTSLAPHRLGVATDDHGKGGHPAERPGDDDRARRGAGVGLPHRFAPGTHLVARVRRFLVTVNVAMPSCPDRPRAIRRSTWLPRSAPKPG